MRACLHLFPFPWLLSPRVSVKWSLLQYRSSHISPDGAADLTRENRAQTRDLFNALFLLLLSAHFQRDWSRLWGMMPCQTWSKSITRCSSSDPCGKQVRGCWDTPYAFVCLCSLLNGIMKSKNGIEAFWWEKGTCICTLIIFHGLAEGWCDMSKSTHTQGRWVTREQ